MINQLLGVGIIVGGLVLEIMWLGVCFGSVVLGVALLIFAPHVLFLPWSVCLVTGLAFLEGS